MQDPRAPRPATPCDLSRVGQPEALDPRRLRRGAADSARPPPAPPARTSNAQAPTTLRHPRLGAPEQAGNSRIAAMLPDELGKL